MNLPALIVGDLARGGTATLATGRDGLCRDGATLAKAVLTWRALSRGGDITAKELARATEAEVRAAKI